MLRTGVVGAHEAALFLTDAWHDVSYAPSCTCVLGRDREACWRRRSKIEIYGVTWATLIASLIDCGHHAKTGDNAGRHRPGWTHACGSLRDCGLEGGRCLDAWIRRGAAVDPIRRHV